MSLKKRRGKADSFGTFLETIARLEGPKSTGHPVKAAKPTVIGPIGGRYYKVTGLERRSSPSGESPSN